MTISNVLPKYDLSNKNIVFINNIDDLNYETWIKTIAAFANCEGGDLVIGIGNKDKELNGCLQKELDSYIRKIVKNIKEGIEPDISYKFEYVPYVENEETRYILIVHVKRSNKIPVVVKENKYNVIYVREEASTVVANPEQIRNLIINSEDITNDEVDTTVKFDKNSFKKLYEVYKENIGTELTEKRLESVGFYNHDGYLKKGSLLFQDNCDYNNTVLHCRLWDGLTKGSSVVLDDKKTKGNLFYLLEYGLKYIRTNTKTGFIKENVGRTNIYSYPKRAIIEALVNALVHRNYMIIGSQIDIDIFADRIDITSPGSLLGGSFVKNYTNLESIPSKRRNQLICDIFAMCKLMEQSGSGFEKIVEDYAKYDDIYKPYISCTNDYFTITLKDVLYKGEQLIDNQFTFAPINGGKRDKDYQILSYCLNDYKSALEIAGCLGFNKSSYFMKNYINPLVDAEYLIPYTSKATSSKQKYITNKEKLIMQ